MVQFGTTLMASEPSCP